MINQRKSLWTIVKDSLKTVGFILWSTLPINFSVLVIGFQNNTPTFWRWGIAILLSVFICWSIRFVWRYYKKHTTDTVQKIGIRDVGIAFVLFLFLRVVAIAGTLLNQSLTGAEMTSNDAALQTTADTLTMFPLYYLIFNLIIGIVAPILEELAFRGIFISTWFKPEQKWLPALLTSSIFSVMHGFDNLLTFSIYFIMGMTFCFAYYRRRNLKDSMLLHMMNNAPTMILSLVMYVVFLING